MLFTCSTNLWRKHLPFPKDYQLLTEIKGTANNEKPL